LRIKLIGIKFELTPPKGVELLNKKSALCEMFKEAQGAEQPFYDDLNNHTRGAGLVCLPKQTISTQGPNNMPCHEID
jgi:hypothetical protein